MVPPPPQPPLAERNLLSRFKGDAKPQSKSARPAPSLALSLRVGSEEETQNRPVSATIHGHDHPSHSSLGRGSSGKGRVPQQPVPPAAAPSPSPPLWPLSAPRRATSIGGAPPRMRAPPVGVGLHLAAGATPTGQQRCDMCSFYYGHLEVATAEVGRLRSMNWNLHRQAMSFREELKCERRKVRQLQQVAAAGDAAAPSASIACPRCAVARAGPVEAAPR